MRAHFGPLAHGWMDELDVRLAEAWGRVQEELKRDPEAVRRRLERMLGPTYTRPLRSWSLVLRAHDGRVDARCPRKVVDYFEWDENQPDAAVERFRIDGETIRAVCGTVVIPWPGVSIDEAARAFGVNRTTVLRWGKRPRHEGTEARSGVDDRGLASLGDERSGRRSVVRTEGRVVIDWYCRRGGGDLHRAEKRVWTRSPVDPNGEVWCGPWGTIRTMIAERVPLQWRGEFDRTHRQIGRKPILKYWRCPACGRWTTKLFWPQPIWTMADSVGGGGASEAARSPIDGSRRDDTSPDFCCWRCAGLIYESAERGSRPGPGRSVDVWDRFVRRISAGVLRGPDLPAANVDRP